MKTNLLQRKQNRLPQYDYSQNGAYFITVCAKDRKCIFANVGATIGRPQAKIRLTEYGNIVKEAVLNIPVHYPAVSVDKFVIMPNHLHMILRIEADNGRPMVAPTISTIMQQMKGYVSKQSGCALWQRSFHDHVIRGEKDYLEIWNYIDINPTTWEQDRFYVPT